MKSKKIKPPVKIKGSKYGIVNWIIENFPPDYEQLIYIEPLCSEGSVFLNKKPSKEEAINHFDQGLVNIFKSLRDDPEEFINCIKKIKICESSFKTEQAKKETDFKDYFDKAVSEFLLRRFSRGGLKKIFSCNESSWKNLSEDLKAIGERFKNCNILNTSAVEVMKVWDEEDSFCYIDPPFIPNSREEEIEESNEVSIEDHIQLINLAKSARGKVMINGQSSSLYIRSFKGWRTKKKNVSGNDKKVEFLWMNY